MLSTEEHKLREALRKLFRACKSEDQALLAWYNATARHEYRELLERLRG